MRLIPTLTAAVSIVVVGGMLGCATKRYPIATDVAPAELALMNCKDIALELVRADQIEKQIEETGSFDARSVAGFLGDFGIGNGMAKGEARKALAGRRASLRGAQLQKGCVTEAAPTTQAPSPPAQQQAAPQPTPHQG